MKEFITVSFEEATKKSLKLATKMPLEEWVDTQNSLGKVLSEDILCVKNLPSFNNSAMDGFAIKHNDLGKTISIQKTIYAGDSIEACLDKDSCYKIMTGAEVPRDVDTIVPFEHTLSYDETSVTLPTNIKKGNALRLEGEEQKVGSTVVEKGKKINSQVISMLASQGISKVKVYKDISIAIFSTGDELKEPWETASNKEIYNVNSSSLQSLLEENGFKADYCGVIPDSLEESIKYFSKMKQYDVLVTSGGISMGEADFIAKALKENGLKTAFHGINIKPGKPTMIGKMEETIVCSMPGNPLAAYVNAYLFLIPILRKLQGITNYAHKKVLSQNKEEFNVKPGRSNIVLGNLLDTQFYVTDKNRYGSGMITPLLKSNAIIVTNEEISCIKESDILVTYVI